jgi:hypothetical protein
VHGQKYRGIFERVTKQSGNQKWPECTLRPSRTGALQAVATRSSAYFWPGFTVEGFGFAEGFGAFMTVVLKKSGVEAGGMIVR